jgi:hypothetical protein
MKTMLSAFVLTIVIGGAMLLAACTTTGGQQLSPSQVATIACPPIQAANAQFIALAAANPTDAKLAAVGAKLQSIAPVVAAACTAASTVTSTDIQNLATQVLPALSQIAGSLNLPADKLANIQAGLVAAEIAVGVVGVVEQNIKSAQAATPTGS